MKNIRRGFTLIELLVVIAILAILCSIFFPVFIQARMAAKQSSDLSNLKQIGLAVEMYSGDFDDYFPRNDYLAAGRHSYDPITFREILGPYVKNGIEQSSSVMIRRTQTGPEAVGGIWASPAQPAGRYGYGANVALFPSGQYMRDIGHCGDNGSSVVFNDQDCAGAPVSGGFAVPSVSPIALPSPAATLMITTVGIRMPAVSASIYMQSGMWWWGGCSGLSGATIPPNWDADVTRDYYDCNVHENGPASSLPRFRYNDGLNILWADGHGKFKKKGSLSWCTDMFVRGSMVDPYNVGFMDDSSAFLPAGVCVGYPVN